jgi:hypothetical protein
VGQKRISGSVLDAESEEPLPGAAVLELASKRGVQTDSNGRFQLACRLDTGWILISFIGFQPQKIRLESSSWKNKRIRLALLQRSEVVITGEKSSTDKVQSTQMSVENLSIKEARLLPAIFGEVDILKTLQLKPGVQSGGKAFQDSTCGAADQIKI